MHQRTIHVKTNEEYLDYHLELDEKLASAALLEEKLILLRVLFSG